MPVLALSQSLRWFARPLTMAAAVLFALSAATGVVVGLQYLRDPQAINLTLEHDRQVIYTLDRLRTIIADLEAERHGYLLTLDPAYLKAYGVSDESVRREAEALQTLVASDPLQSFRARHLALIVSAKLREIDNIVKTAARVSGPAAQAMIRGMDDIRLQIDLMADYERFLLVGLEKHTAELDQRRSRLTAAAIVIVTVFASVALALARLEAKRRRKTTEQNVQLQSDVEQRDRKIRRLVESNIIGIVFWDAAGNYSSANDAFLNIIGYSREDLIAGNISRLRITPAEYHGQDELRLVELRATGRIAPFEKEFVRKGGNRVPVLIGSAMLEGSADEGVAFVLDLTERERAQEKYRLLMEQAHDAILVLDARAVVIEANRNTETLLGRRRDEIVGHALVSIMADAAELDALQATGSAGLRRLRLTGADGKMLDIEVSVAPVSIAGQAAVVLIARDITQRLLLEEQLRQSQKMDAIGQLTGGVAHDFNNILTVIMGSVDLLTEGFADRPNLATIGRMIEEAGTRGADLTKQLLAFARKQTLQPRDTDINTLIIDAARLLSPTLGEEIEIESMLGEECWHAMIDPSQLSAGLLNLAVNGRDAMPNGGKLTFSSANVILDEAYAEANPEVEPGAYVMIAVSDTGTGISAAIRDRVFEPFFTTKEIGKGTGLGLSMVYGFVKQSGGHIKIYSEEGHGTTIKIYLPRSSDEAEGYDMPAPTDSQGGSESILVVEDDALVRHYVTAQFQSLGYTSVSAANGPEALELVDEGVEFDLLFTDVVMPGGMDGRQLAVEIAKRRPGVPVLYTSGYPEKALIRHGRLDPGIALLNKPYRTPDLARMVRQVLAVRGASRVV